MISARLGVFLGIFSLGIHSESLDHKGPWDKTYVLDVVFSPIADPAGSLFAIDDGTALVSVQPLLPAANYPAGSHITFKARVYPGNTFATTGPFTYIPASVIGFYTCSAVLIEENPIFVSGSADLDIALANCAIRFNTSLPGNDQASVQILFQNYLMRSANIDLPGTGVIARTEIAENSGGTGLNDNHQGQSRLVSYLDASGNLLQRIFFAEPIHIPDL